MKPGRYICRDCNWAWLITSENVVVARASLVCHSIRTRHRVAYLGGQQGLAGAAQ